MPAGLAQPKAVHEFRRKPRQGPQRRMVDHLLPPYVECNFRSLHFMMVRFPRVSDFPREKCAPRCLPTLPPERALRLAPSCTRRYPPSPARAGSTSRKALTCSTATTTRTSASAELRLTLSGVGALALVGWRGCDGRLGGIGGTLLACRVRPAAFPFLFIYIFHLAKQMNTEMRTVVYANTVYAPRR